MENKHSLNNLKMVEKFIKENSGDFNKKKLFEKLPKKIILNEFNLILKDLCNSCKIGVDRRGYIVYIYNPKLAKRFAHRRRY